MLSGDRDIMKCNLLEMEFNFIPETLDEPFTRDFTGIREGLVRSQPGGIMLTSDFARNVHDLYTNFHPREDDVWILTFPKSGTHWVSELAWLLLNDCDMETAGKTNNYQRSPFFESQCFTPRKTEDSVMDAMREELFDVRKLEKMPSPRILKSHFPFYLLPPNILNTSKVIYVARNPKDVIVSFFYHQKRLKPFAFTGDVELFANYFMEDKILFAPYFNHVLDAWSKRNQYPNNMLFLFYENMKQDLEMEIKKVCHFLTKSVTDDQMVKLSSYLKFGNLSKNDTIPSLQPVSSEFITTEMQGPNKDVGFYRKGKTGDWKNHFSPELNEKIDQWMKQNLVGSDLRFVTQLDNQD